MSVQATKLRPPKCTLRICDVHFVTCILQLPLLAYTLRGAEPASFAVPQQKRGSCLVVALNPEATVRAPCVLLKDLATFKGATSDLEKRVAALDVADAPAPGGSVIVSKEQVAFRLQLAGIDPRDFRMEGAAKAVVRSMANPGPMTNMDGVLPVSLSSTESMLTERDFETAAQQYLSGRLPWPPEDVRIQLAQPPVLPTLKLSSGDQVRLNPELRPGGSLLGRVFVDIAVLVNGRQSALVPVALDVKRTQQLAVASRRIENGEVVSKENLYADRRVVTEPSQYLTCAECAGGKRAKRTIPAGQLLSRGDVEALPVSDLLVKQHDLVKLMARVGPLRVVALGEALQDGGAGQSIRVRNVDSKSIILGRVVDRSIVEVDY
jgi:flagella basal body P-ring formation protein FlgA